MKNLGLFFLISSVFVSGVFSQSYLTVWTKSYGGPSEEIGQKVHQTADTGYIITGYTKSVGAGESDAWLIKTNAKGDTLWTKTFGGDTWDWGKDVLQTEDGGYLLIVRCYSFGHGNYDAWIIKTDAQGDTLWTKFWGEAPDEWLSSVQQTDDGGFIFTGHTYSFGAKSQDVWLVKSDSTGEIQWMKTYGGDQDDNSSFVQQTRDGGFIIAGRTYSYSAGNSDIWLIKTNSVGDTLWTKAFGGIDYDYAISVRQSKDGGYILVGSTSSFGAGEADIWLIKTDSIGDTLWTKTYGGLDNDRPYSLLHLSDGNYLIGGFTNSTGAGSYEAWLIVTDVNGDSLWTQTFGGVWDDMILDLEETPQGEIIITGYTEVQDENPDLWLMKIALDPVVSVQNNMIPTPFQLNQNFPNPFKTSTTIFYNVNIPSKLRLDILSIDGSLVCNIFEKYHYPGEYQWKWNADGIGNGIYFYRLRSSECEITKKMILSK